MSTIASDLATIATYGDAVEAAARRPYRAAAYDGSRGPRRPRSSVPLNLAALDAGRAARVAVTAAVIAACRHRGDALPRDLGTAPLSHLAEMVHAMLGDGLDDVLSNPTTTPRCIGGRETVASSLASAARPLPRYAPAPAPGATTPAPAATAPLPAAHRDRPVTAAEAVVVLAAVGLDVPASTVRRWGAEGRVRSDVDGRGRRTYRLGDLHDLASSRTPTAPAASGSATATTAATRRTARFRTATTLTREQMRVALGAARFDAVFGSDVGDAP